MRGEAAARLSRRPMTGTCARSQCQDNALKQQHTDAHALRGTFIFPETQLPLRVFLVMQQLKVRED